MLTWIMKLRDKRGRASVVGEICKIEAESQPPKKRSRKKKKRNPKKKTLPAECVHVECKTKKSLSSFAVGAEIPVKKFNRFYALKVKRVISGEEGIGSMWYEQESLEVHHPEEPELFDPTEKPDGFWKGEMRFGQHEVVHIPSQYIAKVTNDCAYCPICQRVFPLDTLDAKHPQECLSKLNSSSEDPGHNEVLITDMNLLTSFRRKLVRGPVGWRHFGTFTTIPVALSKLPELLQDARPRYAVAKVTTAEDLKFCTELIDDSWDGAKPSIHHPTAVVDWTKPITVKLYYEKNFFDYDNEAEKVPTGTISVPYLDFQVFLKTL